MQNTVILTGKIDSIFSTEQFGNYFEKRVFWLMAQATQKPEYWALEMQQGDCETLNKFSAGDVVTCTVVVKGTLSNKLGKTKVFNTLHCIKIEKVK